LPVPQEHERLPAVSGTDHIRQGAVFIGSRFRGNDESRDAPDQSAMTMWFALGQSCD
jgi:hypothetical protein